MAKHEAAALEMRRVLPAPREAVWSAWTRPEVMQRWFAPGPMVAAAVQVDLRTGGSYRIEMRRPDGTRHVTRGEYREIVLNERLVFTWSCEDEPGEESLVTVELRARGKETELVVVHSRHSEEQRLKHREGWEGCLEKLEGNFRMARGEVSA